MGEKKEVKVKRSQKRKIFVIIMGLTNTTRFLDKAEMDSYFFGVVSCLTFFMIIMCYAPDIKSQMRGWKTGGDQVD